MTLTAPPARASEQSRWRRMVPPVLVAGGLGAAVVALHLRDPHQQGSWGACPTQLMGFDCPGCGGLRAVNDLGNGRVLDAASSNLLFVASIPLLAWAWWRWSQGRWTGRPWHPSDRALTVAAVALAVAMVVFTVARNLPGSWLAS